MDKVGFLEGYIPSQVTTRAVQYILTNADCSLDLNDSYLDKMAILLTNQYIELTGIRDIFDYDIVTHILLNNLENFIKKIEEEETCTVVCQ